MGISATKGGSCFFGLGNWLSHCGYLFELGNLVHFDPFFGNLIHFGYSWHYCSMF